MRALDEMKIPYTTHKTWVVGLISGARPGRTVALRADMDGLPLKEPAAAALPPPIRATCTPAATTPM